MCAHARPSRLFIFPFLFGITRGFEFDLSPSEDTDQAVSGDGFRGAR